MSLETKSSVQPERGDCLLSADTLTGGLYWLVSKLEHFEIVGCVYVSKVLVVPLDRHHDNKRR